MAINQTSFKKGNPGGGRPKADPEILAAFQELTPKAIEVIGRILEDPTAKARDRLRAAEIVFDRILGKPMQGIDLAATGTDSIIHINVPEWAVDTSALTEDQKEAIARLTQAEMDAMAFLAVPKF